MGLLVLLVICLAASAQTRITYSEHIAPILDEYCVSCHRPGQPGPFPLLTYEDVRKRAALIAEVTHRRYMPPWLPQHGFGEFAGERRLADAQIATIGRWASAGTPEGDPARRPRPRVISSDWALGQPDLVIEAAQPLTVPADGPDLFWNFILPQPVRRARFVGGVEIRPGNTRVVHHANLLVDRSRSSRGRETKAGQGFPGMDLTFESDVFEPDSHFLFWKPGGAPAPMPDGMSWRLDPANDLVLNVHVRPSGKVEMLRPAIGLYFSDKPPAKVPMLLKLDNDRALDIPPGASDFSISDDFRLPIDVEVLAVYPHAHYLGRLLEAYATLPDASRLPLIRIPEWDVNWQAVYEYRVPLLLPRGSVISMRYHYDNSAANPRNPSSPPRRVRSGNQATDEMGHLWLQVVTRGSGDGRPLLQEALLQHRLERDPNDAGSRLGLGALLLSRNRSAEAAEQLRAALRLAPDDPQALNNLGAALQLQGSVPEALGLFRRALRLRPDYPNARFNLAAALAKHEHLEEAAEQYRLFLAAVPEDREARDQLTAALLRIAAAAVSENRLAAATECYRELVMLDPENADLRSNYGTLLARTGDLPGAIAQFETALKYAPNHAAAQRNLERLRGK